MKRRLAESLLRTTPFPAGHWQAMDVSSSRAHDTHELTDVSMVIDVPDDSYAWMHTADPDMPWAERHFQERVSGIPHNPPPSHEIWPHAVRGNSDHTSGGKFSHTYPERFWPQYAGPAGECPSPEECMGTCRLGDHQSKRNRGVRYRLGDLSDLLQHLATQPSTRQAYLPVWFPEDTGAVEGQRVPCTLGYHFMIRDGKLSCRYYLRSCDLIRHWSNDVYLAGRLMQWVADMLNGAWAGATNKPIGLEPGELRIYISSLHAFRADEPKLKKLAWPDYHV
jgi:hypothetical protein